MLEGAIMEYVKWFIGMFSFMFILVTVIFMFRLNEVNTFQQDVNYQIERHGGLTQEAKAALNEKAKSSYGGCIAMGPEDNAPCLFEADRKANLESSGFFIEEYKKNADNTLHYYERQEQARYGKQINYVMTRQIGSISGASFFKPSIVGTGASRVRGTSDE